MPIEITRLIVRSRLQDAPQEPFDQNTPQDLQALREELLRECQRLIEQQHREVRER
ncbi:DUF5908 family protein [Aliiglaciecola sp. CAU 1673]|uniref:DUF5908 family protein n=1 Tax=Aliiglaciecola sp. CAU 1673 TaxID=3032595 RepID=UPI0023DC8A17|nr:DUF5908 family protein [Aliiglaciecola sp. CAU 1673]MDF2177192.1 DUF5908 family protein [Aliiglaciecola sp. CAU 1673]